MLDFRIGSVARMLIVATVVLAGLLPATLMTSTASAQERNNPQAAWDASKFIWQDTVDARAVQLEGGVDIKWLPKPFIFETGKSVRYIDFGAGDDANPGSKDKPWKHHPWDANAQGQAAAASGIHTYVFKRGVTYRGRLIAADSGAAGDPIRLTSDPNWGQGQATLAGSDAITGGWRKVADDEAKRAGFPDESAGRLWAVKLEGDFNSWALWFVDAQGQRQRQKIARWPNWQIEHKYNHYTQWLRVEKIDKGFPRTTIYSNSLKGLAKDAFKGATIWIDMPVTSGEFSIIGPIPSSVGNYDPEQGSLQPELNHPVRHPAVNTPFYLENLARFLDEPGEWFYSRNGADNGTLYVRLADDRDPNSGIVEVARHEVTLDIVGQQYIEVSGLAFTGGNALELTKAPDVGDYNRAESDSQMPSIRLSGNCQNINLHHLRIHDAAGSGIANFITDKNDVARDISITDCEFERLDNTGIALYRGFNYRRTESQPKARLTNVNLLRNRMHDIGMRHSDPSGGQGIYLNGPEVAEIAGNVIDWTAAQGIDIHGGRSGGGWAGNYPESPLIRMLVNRNKVQDTLLQKQDFGGIEFWATGPVYIYNNLSIDPIGYVAHRNQYHKNHAFYVDHGYKATLFNNIGWSSSRQDAWLGIIGDKFLQEIRNRYNQAFNNTGYNFRGAFSHESTYGDQQQYLANLMINGIGAFHSFYRLKDAQHLAFSHNLYAGKYENFYRRYRGDIYRTIGDLQAYLTPFENYLAKDVGWVSDDMPVRDPEAHDYRLTDASAAIERGVKVFVPWSLYANVGEWHFRLQPDAPGTVLSYDLYPQAFYGKNVSYQLDSTVPGNELKGEGFTAADYELGVLEDWTPGAMIFDGSKSLSLPNATLVKDFSLGDKEKTMFPAKERNTVRMTDNSFLIEAVFRTEKGKAGGTIAGKLDQTAGYALGLDQEGRVVMRLRTNGDEVTQTSGASLTDGRWHHVIAQVDREAGVITLYVDGESANGALQGKMPAAEVSLDNAADFIVGADFHGALDYLRVSRGTLADAQTTIEQLMAWQFNGPACHDFASHPITGEVRDIGALEHPTIATKQPLNYTAPKTETAPDAKGAGDAPADAKADVFKQGPDRTVKQLPWGAVSVPKQVHVGDVIDVQVTFATETIPKPQIMRIDLHAMVGAQRKPGHGQAAPIKVEPTVTKPYAADLKLRAREGMTGVIVVIYVSPDGAYKDLTVSTEVGVKVIADEGKKPEEKPAADKPEAKKPVVDPPAKVADGGDKPATADGIATRDLKWATVEYPTEAKVGQKVSLKININADAIDKDVLLVVDTHWFKGRQRKQGGGTSGKYKIKASEAQSVIVNMTIPDREGISAVQYVLIVSPTGGWVDRVKSGEVGIKVTR